MNIEVALDPTARATSTLPSAFSALKMLTVSMHSRLPARSNFIVRRRDEFRPGRGAGGWVGQPVLPSGLERPTSQASRAL